MKKVTYIATFFAGWALGLFVPRGMEHKSQTDIEVGDSFAITIPMDDPFKKPIVISGRVLDKKDDYIQYRNKYGMINSLDISRYAIRMDSEIKIIKKKE